MFCSKCGANIQEGIKFCNFCGNPIGGTGDVKVNNAVWESISVQVSPAEENSTIEEHEWFGWELKSSQTIDRKSSHLEGGYDAVYSVTESVNYIKLVFKRNKNMPNYEEIKQLENIYRTSSIEEMPKGPSKGWIISSVIFGIPSIFAALSGNFASLINLIFPIIFLTIYFNKKKKYKEEYDRCVSANEQAQLDKYEALRKLEELRGITCAL